MDHWYVHVIGSYYGTATLTTSHALLIRHLGETL